MRSSFKKISAVITAAVILFGILPFASFAKDMEECSLCNKTGEYHCRVCGNKGETVCDGCGGKGRFECPGEEEKGKCDNGYYVCPSCNGDGLSKPIPADGNAGPCGQCGGSGKLECWHCHGAGIIVCDRCGGAGKCECSDVNCVEARKIGYKCPRCKGTGFTGDDQDFPPEWNDGVHNVPEVGDHIITDHKTWTGYYYGTGKTDKDIQKENGNENEEKRDPATGRDYVWFIDVGSGVFEVEGQTITIKRNGSPVSGIIDVKYDDPVEISGITKNHVHVYIVGANGYKAELGFLNGDHEVSIGSRVQKNTRAPFELSLLLEYDKNDGQPDGQNDTIRSVDFGNGSWFEDDGTPVTALIDGARVSGVIELDENTSVKLENFDRENMIARIYADDGFSVTLVLSGEDELNLNRYEPEESVLAAGTLHFIIEKKAKEPDTSDVPDTSMPHDRNADYDVLPAPEGETRTSAKIEVGRMTGEERKYYAELSDEELTGIIDDVRNIVSTLQPGRSDPETDKLLEKLAKYNGFESLDDGRFCQMIFDGHRDIGFPVKVTAVFNRGDLNGGSDIYVYHITQSGSIESLGKAEYGTYDDGSVETISFFTTGFSVFFTASKELELGKSADTADASESLGETASETEDGSAQSVTAAESGQNDNGGNNAAPVVITVIAVVCAAAAVAAVLLIRKKRA